MSSEQSARVTRTVRLRDKLTFSHSRDEIQACILTNDSVEVRVTPRDDGTYDADIEVAVLSVPVPVSPISPADQRLLLLEREVRHLARMIDERFSGIANDSSDLRVRVSVAEESAQSAHDRLQLHDRRLTKIEESAVVDSAFAQNRVGSVTESIYRLEGHIGVFQSNIDEVRKGWTDLSGRIDGVVRRLNSGSRDEAYGAIFSRIEALERSADPAVLAAVTRVESEWKVEGLKYSNDIRRLSGRVTELDQQLAAHVARIAALQREVLHNARTVDDLARTTDERFNARAEPNAPKPHPTDVIRDGWRELEKQRSPLFDPRHGIGSSRGECAESDAPVATGVEFGASMYDRDRRPRKWFDGLSTEQIWEKILANNAPGSDIPGGCVVVPVGFLRSSRPSSRLVERLGQCAEHLRQTREALTLACCELGCAETGWNENTNLADVISKVLMPTVRARIADFSLATGNPLTHCIECGGRLPGHIAGCSLG